mgnify:CR=1 FL=1
MRDASTRGEGFVFLSHQWVGWSEPDPQRIHIKAMQQAVRFAEVRLSDLVHQNETCTLDFTGFASLLVAILRRGASSRSAARGLSSG